MSESSRHHRAKLFTVPLHYRKPLIWAIAASVVGFVSMGATGMLVFSGADWLLERIVAEQFGWERPHGDTVWPTAIMYALATPWVAFIAFVVTRRLHSRRSRVISITSLTAAMMLMVHLLYRMSAT